MAVVMKSSLFWDITPCSPLKDNGRFGGTSPAPLSSYWFLVSLPTLQPYPPVGAQEKVKLVESEADYSHECTIVPKYLTSKPQCLNGVLVRYTCRSICLSNSIMWQ
jgi:hypothetical protein